MANNKIVTVGNAQLNVQQYGEKPERVLVHGFGENFHSWDEIVAAFDPSISWLRYDLRGFGGSTYSDTQSFSHSEDLLAVFDAAGIEQCDLIGSSMGGAVALAFALDYPERVRNLVLISPGIVAWEWSQSWMDNWMPMVKKARAGDIEGARELWWQHPLFESTRKTDAAQKLYDGIQHYSGAEWIKDYQQEAYPDVDRLHTLSVRTLLLTGDKDVEEFQLIADVIEASVPGIQRIRCEDLGHLLHFEDPVRCAEYITAFLSSTT